MNGQIPVQIRPVELDVICVGTPKEMEDAVNHRLKEGWLFHGDMKVIATPENVAMWTTEYTGGKPVLFVQALVRTEVVPVPMPRGGGSNILVPQ